MSDSNSSVVPSVGDGGSVLIEPLPECGWAETQRPVRRSRSRPQEGSLSASQGIEGDRVKSIPAADRSRLLG
jgi:hypothetical protein